MKFPRNNNELKKIFRKAYTPDISEFSGEYLVDMLTFIPGLNMFPLRKIFYVEHGGVSGYNILFKKVWGHFFLEKGICKEVDSLNTVVINYNRTENSAIIRNIRDDVRCLEKGNLYLGRFNYILMGNHRFLGYFSLSRMK
jgi:hypothetical protein